MRHITMLVAAACLLAAPLASAAQCGGMARTNITAQRAAMGAPGGFISTGAQLADEVEGTYKLSNGRWLELIDLDQRIYADFGKWNRIELREIGPHQFASRGGDVQMTWMPGRQADTILLSYPADSRGRLMHGCG